MQPLDFLPRVLLLGSIAATIFAFGIATGTYKLFPYELLRSAKEAAVDLGENHKSYLGIEPTKFLHNSSGVDGGVTVNNIGAAMPGLTLLTGIFDGKVGLQLVGMDGSVVRRWNVSFNEIFPEAAHLVDRDVPWNDWDTHIHGAVALPDGSVVFNFEYMGLVKLGRCGAVVWKLPHATHHSVDIADDGTFWVPNRRITTQVNDKTLWFMKRPFREDTVLQVSSTGEVLHEFSLLRILAEAGYEGALLPTGADDRRSELMHLNDVEVLRRDQASAFPMFAVGDLMVSMRNLNLVVVFDPESGYIKWHQTGPWLWQHDPDFAPLGRIVIFNNRRGIGDRPTFGGSNILEVDPKTRETDVIYKGSKDRPFFTAEMGQQQLLQNGNILITSSEQGRAFEVDRNGTIVWEFVNRYNEDSVALLNEAYRYKDDYFKVGDWSCD